jgi:putative tricarboxylic transport membrane protein
MMLASFIDGLLIVLQWNPFLYMLIGSAVGFVVGILPGLGGAATLALMIPFVYKMTPQEAFPFLLGMHSVVQTTGDITSVLFGIPGESTTVATVLDGYAMTKKGQAGRALGAALMSSLVGAIIGAFFLALAIPIVRPLVLAFGTPEMLMIVLLGMTCISTLSGRGKRGLLLGLMAGGIGFSLALVGQDNQSGILRFTFGTMYLYNGIPIIPLVVGLFAVPEIVDMYVAGTSISRNVDPTVKLGSGVWQGIKDTFIHFWLTVRCSLIGAFFGLMPGLGAGVAQWVSYAHATQSAKTMKEREGFGKGDVRGVLGPGAANNSKEGASLIPTVAFGIPAAPGMAILLGAFYVLGLVPGPDMLTKHLSLTFSMVWTIVISNIITVAVSLLFINHLARLTFIRGNLLIPFILLLVFIGAYTTSNDIGDLIVVLVFGGLGYLMVRGGWPRPPLILGFVLGDLVETNLYTCITLYGADWLYRPKVIVLFILAVFVALYPLLREKYLLKKQEVQA